jgi:phosphoribosyl 1,2-cyclic phosphodiesterase
MGYRQVQGRFDPEDGWKPRIPSGILAAGYPVAVDNFSARLGARVFFLTHFHTDHTVGLEEHAMLDTYVLAGGS